MAIEHADKIEYKLFSKYSVQNQIHRRTHKISPKEKEPATHTTDQQQQKNPNGCGFRIWTCPDVFWIIKIVSLRKAKKNSKVRVYK